MRRNAFQPSKRNVILDIKSEIRQFILYYWPLFRGSAFVFLNEPTIQFNFDIQGLCAGAYFEEAGVINLRNLLHGFLNGHFAGLLLL